MVSGDANYVTFSPDLVSYNSVNQNNSFIDPDNKSARRTRPPNTRCKCHFALFIGVITRFLSRDLPFRFRDVD
jgi:hypothetical protein